MNARISLNSVLAGASAGLAVLLSGTAAIAVDPAVELAIGEGDAGPFYMHTSTWIAAALVVLLAASARPAWRAISGKLDAHTAEIATELNEAQRLREEAQHTLAEYQRKQRDALQDAEAILAEARDEAVRIVAGAAQRTEAMLKRREQQALDMIAAAETSALSEVRNTAVDIAIAATRRLMIDEVDGSKGDAMIDAAIRDLPGKLN